MRRIYRIIFGGLPFLLLMLLGLESPNSRAAGQDVSATSLSPDFKIAADTVINAGGEFFNVSVASDSDHGFLVTWISTYKIGSTRYTDNYACRISKTGDVLDAAAIDLGGNPTWWYYCPSAVFAGGNWIIASSQDYMYEWIGAVRLSPTGVVLDATPVNICWSTGMATILYPTIATNGQEILCVTGIAGEGLYGSIFDPDLNILVDKFLILAEADAQTAYRITTNGNNFFVTWLNWGNAMDSNIKLAIVEPDGDIQSIQTVNEDGNLRKYRGAPTITTLNDTTYITYFSSINNTAPSTMWVRRYDSAGAPIDSSAVSILESPDFDPILEEISFGYQTLGYADLAWANESFNLYWPKPSETGMSMMGFNSDLSKDYDQPALLNSQCQIQQSFGQYGYDRCRSIIRSASLGNKVLTTWIDGREGAPRVYANMFPFKSMNIFDGHDFNGDGISDVSVWKPSNGRWYIQGQSWPFWGGTGDIPANGDYNGDGTTDVAVWKPSNGRWYIKGQSWPFWGATGDLPVPADYDGDGATDVAVWRPANGRWYVKGQAWPMWGAAEDVPVPGDYDGNGLDDIAVWRPSDGTWYIKGQAWPILGQPWDIPVPGDYNGDGITEIGVWRSSEGKWYIAGQTPQAWGQPGDVPVPGDYNGDSITDIAVWRPSNGRWYIKGQSWPFWGGIGDMPLVR